VVDIPAHCRGLDQMTFKCPFQPILFYDSMYGSRHVRCMYLSEAHAEKKKYDLPVCFPKPYLGNTTICSPTRKTNGHNLACNSNYEFFCFLLQGSQLSEPQQGDRNLACRLLVVIHTKPTQMQHHKPFHTSHEIIQPNNYLHP